MCKKRRLIIKENFNTKNDMMECNILCNRRQLTIPKNITNYKQLIFDVFISNLHINKLNEQQIKKIIKFQKRYNYKSWFIKSAFASLKQLWICCGRCHSVNWKIANKIKNIKPFKFHETYTFYNKEEYIIECVNVDKITFTSGHILKTDNVNLYFQPHYARTIDSYQGDKLTIPFGIVGVKSKYFTVERFNSSVGRAINKDLVHIDFYDENRIFEYKTYPNHIMLDVIPKQNDCSNVSFYAVWYEDVLMYVGTTTQEIDDRMEQHFKDNHDDKFHQWLKQINHADIVVKRINDAPTKFDYWGDVEDYEMSLVQKLSPLLNTRTKTRRQELIKFTEAEINNTITKEKFDKIKHYDKITEAYLKNIKTQLTKNSMEIIPHYFNMSNENKIRLTYTHNGVQYQKQLGYVKIGYEKAKLQLEQYFKQEMDKLKPDEEPEFIYAEDLPEIINDDDDEPDTDDEFIQNQYKF